MSGDIFCHYKWGVAPGIWWVEIRDCPHHPAVHRRSHPRKPFSPQWLSPGVENPETDKHFASWLSFWQERSPFLSPALIFDCHSSPNCAILIHSNQVPSERQPPAGHQGNINGKTSTELIQCVGLYTNAARGLSAASRGHRLPPGAQGLCEKNKKDQGIL